MQRLETTLRSVLSRDSLCKSGFVFACDCPKDDEDGANGVAIDGAKDEEDDDEDEEEEEDDDDEEEDEDEDEERDECERGISGDVLRAR